MSGTALTLQIAGCVIRQSYIPAQDLVRFEWVNRDKVFFDMLKERDDLRWQRDELIRQRDMVIEERDAACRRIRVLEEQTHPYGSRY